MNNMFGWFIRHGLARVRDGRVDWKGPRPDWEDARRNIKLAYFENRLSIP